MLRRVSLHFEQVAVVARSETAPPAVAVECLFAMFEDLLAHLRALLGLIRAREQDRPGPTGADRPQVFGKPLASVGNDGVGYFEMGRVDGSSAPALFFGRGKLAWKSRMLRIEAARTT